MRRAMIAAVVAGSRAGHRSWGRARPRQWGCSQRDTRQGLVRPGGCRVSGSVSPDSPHRAPVAGSRPRALTRWCVARGGGAVQAGFFSSLLAYMHLSPLLISATLNADGEETLPEKGSHPHLHRLHHRTFQGLRQEAVCAGSSLRRTDGPRSRTPLRPAQSGWEAGFGDAPQIREEAAVGLDEGDWHALNAKGRGGDGEGGGGGAGEKGASGVLGMSLLSWRNRRPRPAILFEGGLPSRTRFKNGEALNCLSILRSPCIHSLRSVSLNASVSILSLLIVDPHRVRCAACGLGRKLKPEEVRHFANTARRVAAALQTTRNR